MEGIATYVPGILMVYTAFLLAIASPGPNILAVIGTSMSAGRHSGAALALGVAGGSLTWSTLTVMGLSSLLASYGAALLLIKIFGGLTLLWLAYKAFRSATSAYESAVTPFSGTVRSTLGYATRGYIIMMTNPKAIMAWIAIVSLGLNADTPHWVGWVIVLGTFTLSLLIHLLYAVVFSTPLMVGIYSKARRFIQCVLGSFFSVAGLKLLLSSL